jgi:hypothetical protein
MFARYMGAYSSETTFTCSTLGYATGLTHKHQTRLERLAKDKHSSLLRTLVNYGRKTFYNIGSCVRLVHLTGLFEMHSKATQATVKLTACFLNPLSLSPLLSHTHTHNLVFNRLPNRYEAKRSLHMEVSYNWVFPENKIDTFKSNSQLIY